ncbi:hypothetical protein [Paenibacillus elgii]|uniref:hypothetical protein n=1 Tax=Paenibacillus elgii TaxID=189691 RepID=UPI000248E088|nr:hypothetical protein [Paenibacillus elgii]
MKLEVNSKYFTYLIYDEGIESLQVNYTTGKRRTFDDVEKTDFEKLLKAGNKDLKIMELIRDNLEGQRITFLQMRDGFAEKPKYMHESEVEIEIEKIDEQLKELEKMMDE